MKRVEISHAAWSLVAANMVPLAGVFLFGWDAAAMVVLYWMENLVVGFYNVLKMICLRVYARASHLELLFFIPFFCLHYGMFCAVHGYILWLLFSFGGPAAPVVSVTGEGGLLDGLRMLGAVLWGFWQQDQPGKTGMVFCLFVSHGVSFVQNYLGRKEYRSWNAPRLMLLPYQRIVVLHLAVLAGAMLVRTAGSPVWLMVVLVFAKTALDLLLHQKEHRPHSQQTTLEIN